MSKEKGHKGLTKYVEEYCKELEKHFDNHVLYYERFKSMLFVDYLKNEEDRIRFTTEHSGRISVRSDLQFYYLERGPEDAVFKKIPNLRYIILKGYYDYLCEKKKDNMLYYIQPDHQSALELVFNIELCEDHIDLCGLDSTLRIVCGSEIKIYPIMVEEVYLQQVVPLLTMKQFEKKE